MTPPPEDAFRRGRTAKHTAWTWREQRVSASIQGVVLRARPPCATTTYLPTYLPTCLPTHMSACLPTYLP